MVADDIFFEIQLMSFFWILGRSKKININWVDWCKGSSFSSYLPGLMFLTLQFSCLGAVCVSCCLGCCLFFNISSGSVRVALIGQHYAKSVSVLRWFMARAVFLFGSLSDVLLVE